MAFKGYKLETELCADFIEYAESTGWIVYPETNDWDIFLVSNKSSKNVKIGDQIGIEAKLKPNLKVLDQAHTRAAYYKSAGPDFVCALVPTTTKEFSNVATALGIVPVPMYNDSGDNNYIKVVKRFESYLSRRFRRIHSEKLWVPEIKIAVEAGSAGPRKVTHKKILLVQHCLNMLDNNGMCTTDEFEANKAGNYRTWLNLGWIRDSGMKSGSRKLWVLNPHSSDRPDRKWPEIVKSLRDHGSTEIH